MLLLSACSVGNEEDKQKVEKDLVEESSLALQKDEKETLAIDILEEKAMYTFEGKQGDEEFFVYFHAENEVEEKLDSASYLGQEGDLMRSGDYSFYIAAKGDTIAYKQDQLDALSLTFNSEAEKHSPIYMDDYTIFSIFTHEASDAWEPHLYTLSEGELVQIESSALGHLLTTKLKVVDTDKLQTVSYNNEGEENDFGWNFSTFEMDRASLSLELIANAVYNDTKWGLDKGDERYQLWMKEEASVVPYRNINDLKKIVINKETLKQAENNELGDISVKLGDDMADLISKDKETEVKVWHKGTEAVRYLGYIVYFTALDDEPLTYSGEIVELALPSERIQMTVEEVIDVLGEPVSHEYDDAEQQYSARYETGDNNLIFSYVEKGDSVYVELR